MGGAAGRAAEVTGGVAGIVVGVGAGRRAEGANLVDGVGDLVAGAVVVSGSQEKFAVTCFTDIYGVPVLLVALVKHMPQASAFPERPIINECDAVRKCNAGQAGTFIKRRIANAGDTVGNGDAGQAGTAIECITTNTGNTVRDGDAG